MYSGTFPGPAKGILPDVQGAGYLRNYYVVQIDAPDSEIESWLIGKADIIDLDAPNVMGRISRVRAVGVTGIDGAPSAITIRQRVMSFLGHGDVDFFERF